MRIQLTKAGKRYGYRWVLKNISLNLKDDGKYAIVGPNGSGKSTLLKIMAGFLTPSSGNIKFFEGQQTISPNDVYRSVAFAAPYIDLIESFTLREAIDFHFKFKSLQKELTREDVQSILNLNTTKSQRIQYFSSGMQQRVKLALAFCTDCPLLFLDEPTSNLDRQGVQWYQELVQRFTQQRLVVVASNIAEDYHFCHQIYNVEEWK